jgi:hypothetical protein
MKLFWYLAKPINNPPNPASRNPRKVISSIPRQLIKNSIKNTILIRKHTSFTKLIFTQWVKDKVVETGNIHASFAF